MAPSLKPLALAAALLLSSATTISAQASGSGSTTRYWDCCKPSCAWSGKGLNPPVTTCDKSDNPLSDADAVSGCESGGQAFMCTNQSPWAVDESVSYGFAAVRITGQTEAQWCCACYELTFTSGPVSGKKMVVQATNTGADLGENHFDIAMPGGGVGIFNGCTDQWGAPPNGWGERYGGITSNTCAEFPAKLQPGCNWRFEWFQAADNPTVDFKEVQCPSELTSKSGCSR